MPAQANLSCGTFVGAGLSPGLGAGRYAVDVLSFSCSLPGNVQSQGPNFALSSASSSVSISDNSLTTVTAGVPVPLLHRETWGLGNSWGTPGLLQTLTLHQRRHPIALRLPLPSRPNKRPDTLFLH